MSSTVVNYRFTTPPTPQAGTLASPERNGSQPRARELGPAVTYRNVRCIPVTITIRNSTGATVAEKSYEREVPMSGDADVWPLQFDAATITVPVDDPATIRSVHLISDAVFENGEIVDAAISCNFVRAAEAPTPVVIIPQKRIVKAKRLADGSLEATWDNVAA